MILLCLKNLLIFLRLSSFFSIIDIHVFANMQISHHFQFIALRNIRYIAGNYDKGTVNVVRNNESSLY